MHGQSSDVRFPSRLNEFRYPVVYNSMHNLDVEKVTRSISHVITNLIEF